MRVDHVRPSRITAHPHRTRPTTRAGRRAQTAAGIFGAMVALDNKRRSEGLIPKVTVATPQMSRHLRRAMQRAWELED